MRLPAPPAHTLRFNHGRRRIAFSAVNVTAVPKRDDDYDQTVIFDLVDNPVITDPYAPRRTPDERSRSRRTRVLGKQRDSPLNPTGGLRVKLAKLPGGCWTELDLVGHSLGPAEISLDLIPRDVRAVLGHGFIKCRDVCGIVGGSE